MATPPCAVCGEPLDGNILSVTMTSNGQRRTYDMHERHRQIEYEVDGVRTANRRERVLAKRAGDPSQESVRRTMASMVYTRSDGELVALADAFAAGSLHPGWE